MTYNNDIDALKALYSKLGGDDDVTGINTSSDMIGKLVEVVEAGGGGNDGDGGNNDIIIPLGAYNSNMEAYALGGGYTYESILDLIRSGNYNLVIHVLKTGLKDGSERTLDCVFRYSYCSEYALYHEYGQIYFSCPYGSLDENQHVRPAVYIAKVFEHSGDSYVMFLGYALSTLAGGAINFDNL